MGPLVDRFGRPVTGVRISVISSKMCNLHCIFCHGEGEDRMDEKLMKPDEIERISRILKGFGVKEVKLTGGEPTMRNDIVEIVERLSSLGFDDLSMTTNGYRMPELAKRLKSAGLKRVNISLHTTYPDRYRFITGGGDYENERLVNFIGGFGAGDGIVLQLIELEMVGSAKGSLYEKYHMGLEGYEEMLKKIAVKDSERKMHKRHRYMLPNGVWVELVKPMNNPTFCMNCTRIRITHDGKFKTCLLRQDDQIDFLTAMRNGASDEELAEIYKRAVLMREPFFKP